MNIIAWVNSRENCSMRAVTSYGQNSLPTLSSSSIRARLQDVSKDKVFIY